MSQPACELPRPASQPATRLPCPAHLRSLGRAPQSAAAAAAEPPLWPPRATAAGRCRCPQCHCPLRQSHSGWGLALVWLQAAVAAVAPQPRSRAAVQRCCGRPIMNQQPQQICEHTTALLRTSHDTELAVQGLCVGRPGVVRPAAASNCAIACAIPEASNSPCCSGFMWEPHVRWHGSAGAQQPKHTGHPAFHLSKPQGLRCGHFGCPHRRAGFARAIG